MYDLCVTHDSTQLSELTLSCCYGDVTGSALNLRLAELQQVCVSSIQGTTCRIGKHTTVEKCGERGRKRAALK